MNIILVLGLEHRKTMVAENSAPNYSEEQPFLGLSTVI